MDVTDEQIRSAILQELKGMDGAPPSELREPVEFRLRKTHPEGLSESELIDLLTTADRNSALNIQLRIQLSRWDASEAESWTVNTDGEPTKPNTAERRNRIYDLLELGPDGRERLDVEYPHDLTGATVVSDIHPWDPWYTEERQHGHTFYWNSYKDVLGDGGWNGDAIGKLDSATTEVVKRLADPTRPIRYQSKGLVVGYVQSGKTANFTGVIAKAIDAGYRLIIILTGTVEILRSQTQRRLDMELVGEENIIGGVDRNDPVAMSQVDYANKGDQDWLAGKFRKHGITPIDHDGIPSIRRLTSPNWDYKKLLAGLGTLDFRQGNELKDRRRPLYDPVNLYYSDVRLAVVKKNKSTLEKLVTDLGNIHQNLADIPTLIIDDEADQASVNTVRPRGQGRRTAEDRERSAINKKIAELMGKIDRCQYVGYTATPFANVFVDPDDSEDVFPKDFIISLDRPDGYMGGTDFHDIGVEYGDEEKTYANSNELAYVRELVGVGEDERYAEHQKALDAFVLSGAIKLYRQAEGSTRRFRHHTMLVHESVKQAEHGELADELRALWKLSGYSTLRGMDRLRRLWNDDHEPVCRARAKGDPVPPSFDVLRRYIGAAVDKISDGTTPVLIVNGDKEKDYLQPELDFQADNVWKILVGGTKLSRGFTVEGLTVSFYTRRTQQADTLMQMGRWFGFRNGYEDLVRLFIGRKVPGPGSKTVDLYEAFEAIVRDEEEFREELRKYSRLDDQGRPTVKPEDVPPMVFQQLPWLKPTGTNKMYNAELTVQGKGGEVRDLVMLPPAEDQPAHAKNFEAVQPLLAELTEAGTFVDSVGKGTREYQARYGIVPASRVIDVLDQLSWAANYSIAPHRAFLIDAENRGTLLDWVVVLPELKGSAQRTIGDCELALPVINRKRRTGQGRLDFSGSSPRQRAALKTIAGVEGEGGGKLAEELCTGTRAAVLLNFAVESDPNNLPSNVDAGEVATLLSYVAPLASAPNGRIGFVSKRSGEGAIIDRA